MNYLVVGNIIAFIGSLLMVGSGLFNNKKNIIFVQSLQILCFIISNLVLKGFTGAIVNSLSFVRNIFAYNDKLNKPLKAILIILAIIFCILFNNRGIIGYLPLISTCIYTLFMTTSDVVNFKLLFILTFLLWSIYDFYIMSYTSALFDIATVFASIFTLIFAFDNKKAK